MKLNYVRFRCKDCKQDFVLPSKTNRTLCPECRGRRQRYSWLQRKIPFGLTPPEWEEYKMLKAFFEWKKGKNKQQQLVDYTPPTNRKAVIKRKGPAT